MAAVVGTAGYKLASGKENDTTTVDSSQQILGEKIDAIRHLPHSLQAFTVQFDNPNISQDEAHHLSVLCNKVSCTQMESILTLYMEFIETERLTVTELFTKLLDSDTIVTLNGFKRNGEVSLSQSFVLAASTDKATTIQTVFSAHDVSRIKVNSTVTLVS